MENKENNNAPERTTSGAKKPKTELDKWEELVNRLSSLDFGIVLDGIRSPDSQQPGPSRALSAVDGIRPPDGPQPGPPRTTWNVRTTSGAKKPRTELDEAQRLVNRLSSLDFGIVLDGIRSPDSQQPGPSRALSAVDGFRAPDTPQDHALPDEPEPAGEAPMLHIDIVPMCMSHGEYWYGGIARVLRLNSQHLAALPTISLRCHTDGSPVYNADGQLYLSWPISFEIVGHENLGVYRAAMYCGLEMPTPEYMLPFAREANALEREGIVLEGRAINVRARLFTVDSQARALITATKGLTSKHGCARCDCVAEHSFEFKCRQFPSEATNVRQNDAFRRGDYVGQHQLGPGDNPRRYNQFTSPLLEIEGLDVVNDVVCVDSLHFVSNVWYHLFKALPELAGIVPLATIKMLCTYLPAEVNQDCIARVNFREHLTMYHYRFLSWYVLIVPAQRSESYQWILRFVVAIFMMSSDFYTASVHEAAVLLQDFLRWYRNGTTDEGSPQLDHGLHPLRNTTGMVHNAIHLHEDVQRHGNLAVNSTYNFEISLRRDKTISRTARQSPLFAMVNYYLKHEAPCFDTEPYPHIRGKTLYMRGYSLSAKENERWFLTRSYEVAFVIDFCGRTISAGRLEHVDSYNQHIANLVNCHTLPDLHWYQTTNVNTFVLQDVSIDDVFCKLVAIPKRNESYAFFPLLESLH